MRLHRKGARSRYVYFERLENRELLDGHGIVWGVDAGLSLSFVPDGTHVGSQTSSLFDKFDQLAPRDVWQDAILRGFQKWARHTNADIAVVEDDGSDLGVPGATSGDPRFGDVRVTAIPMASDLFATSIPTDELVDGTWVGDVFFNSTANIETVDQLFAVALHEAGHVFGLDHNGDIGSPLYQHDVPTSTTPTPIDIAALQANFGLRRTDEHENSGAQTIEIKIRDEDRGATPGIVFGTIASASDVDDYRLDGLDKDLGPLSVRLLTDGISLLRGKISVLTEDGTVLGQSDHDEATSNGQVVTLSTLPKEVDEVTLRVESGKTEPFDVGGYTVIVAFDDLNSIPDQVVDDIARNRIRSIDQDDIQRFFGAEFHDDDEVFVDDDEGSDDSEGQEIELTLDDSFPDAHRFVTTNAISNPEDVDRYEIRIPADEQNDVMTISLTSLNAGYRAHVTVRNDEGKEVHASRVINNESSSNIQVLGIEPDARFTFEVRRHERSTLPVGNYELAIRFGQTATVRPTMLTGILESDATQDEHALRVSRTQLFQFGLDGNGLSSPSDHIRATILNADGSIVGTIEAAGGELETITVLLLPGEYSFVFSSTMPGAANVSYRLTGNVVDEPLGPEPIDPTEDPFCGYEWLSTLFSCFQLMGDLDGDGTVSFKDFLTLSNNFGRQGMAPEDGDLNGDALVDFADFLRLSEHFGKTDPQLDAGDR